MTRLYPGRIANRTLVGMSAPLAQYADRLKSTGKVYSQRVYCALGDDKSAYVKSSYADQRLSVASYKIPNNDWAGCAAGKYDAQVKATLAPLQALGTPVVVAFHHEPSGDGAAADWAAMQVHLAPIVKAYSNIAFAVIGNGFWWGAQGGLSDADLATYFPPALRAVADVIAADFYESDRNQTLDLLKRFVAWADRVKVTEIGIGEIGTYTAQALADSINYILANPSRFGFAIWFNSERNSRADWVLAGDRLTAFQAAVAASVPAPAPAPAPAPTPTPTPVPVDPTVQINTLTAQVNTLTAQVANLSAQLSAAQSALAASQTSVAAAATENAALRAKITAGIEALNA